MKKSNSKLNVELILNNEISSGKYYKDKVDETISDSVVWYVEGNVDYEIDRDFDGEIHSVVDVEVIYILKMNLNWKLWVKLIMITIVLSINISKMKSTWILVTVYIDMLTVNLVLNL